MVQTSVVDLDTNPDPGRLFTVDACPDPDTTSIYKQVVKFFFTF